MKHTIRYEAYLKVHPDRREELDERAGILEYDGKFSRSEAEDMAVKIVDKKHKEKKK